MSNLSTWLEPHRPEHLSCSEIARVMTDAGIRCDRVQVYRWLAGERRPSTAQLAALMDALGVPDEDRHGALEAARADEAVPAATSSPP